MCMRVHIRGSLKLFKLVLYTVCPRIVMETLDKKKKKKKRTFVLSIKNMATKQLIRNSLPYSASLFDLVFGRLEQGAD